MKQEITLKHEFVEFIPEDLKEGTVYISVRFATVSHLCVCGCKSKVVTPLTPTDWQLIFDGKTISLDPSIGNWSFACKSHYWIRNNRVKWATQWSQEQIDRGRNRDRYAKEKYFGGTQPMTESVPGDNPEALVVRKPGQALWRTLGQWLSSRGR
jgi:hypothetical protein